jgi:hypothetical protein
MLATAQPHLSSRPVSLNWESRGSSCASWDPTALV